MKHDFTDEQITTAANNSRFRYGEYNTSKGYTWSMTVDSLRNFLNALPEPEAGTWTPHGQPYTWEEINKALIEASDRYPQLRGMEVNPIAHVLRHLPAPVADEWEECTLEDIREGDRVKVVKQNGDYMVFTAESADRLLVHGEDCHVSHTTTATLYRIPAPVQHPDPENHPVIIVHESTVLPKGSAPQEVMFIRPYYRNDIWNGAPETITEWEPGRIVPAGDV